MEVGPSLSHLRGGYQNILWERGDNPEKGEGWCRNGGCHFLYCFTVQVHLVCVLRKSKVSFITFWFFSLLSYPCMILIPSHCIICIILIHSDSVQKMLTALFKLVWNTGKTTWTGTKARCFLILKMFSCLNALPYCFFLHIFEIKVSHFYWLVTWEI